MLRYLRVNGKGLSVVVSNFQKKLPMYITISRIAITPPIAMCIWLNQGWGLWTAAILFIIGASTDYLDGYYARKYNAESNLGRLMDPVADKILVTVTLLMLLPLRKVDPFMVGLLLTRDLVIGAIRAAAAADNLVIDAKAFGKWKTAIQLGCVPALLIDGPVFGVPIHLIGYIGLWISVSLSVISAWEYIQLYRNANRTQKGSGF